MLRDGIAEGDPDARVHLAVLFEEQGELEKAEQVYRDGIAAGEPRARADLAVLFEERGTPRRPSSCTGTASPLVSQGLGQSWPSCLRREGPSRKAEVCTAEPSPLVSQALGRIWQRCSRDAGARWPRRCSRLASRLGSWTRVRSWLACWEKRGEPEKAEAVLREGIAVGEPDARADLAAYSSNEATRRRRRLCSGQMQRPTSRMLG